MQRHINRLLAATILMATARRRSRRYCTVVERWPHLQDDQKRLIAPKDLHPDTISIIDVAHYPPRITATVEVPGSVVGPPTAAWVAKDESWAIVTPQPRRTRRPRTGSRRMIGSA